MRKLNNSPNPLKRVGGERNLYGTRVRRRIDCARCGAEDYVSVNPTKNKETLCRACAKKELNAVEIGIEIPEKKNKYSCFECKVVFELPAVVLLDKDEIALCPNCMKGFAIWRGSCETDPAERGKQSIEKRRSGTLLRKKRA